MAKLVLVVDDSALIRRQARGALVGAGFEVVEAEDGVEAMECLSKFAGISLIVSDVRMPRMDGLELLRRLHARGRVPALPFLLLTSVTDVGQIERARDLGARGWMAKPFRAERLVATVQRLMDRPRVEARLPDNQT